MIVTFGAIRRVVERAMMLGLVATVTLLVMFAPVPSWADARSDAKAQVAFGIEVAQHGLWKEAQYRFERAVAIDPTYAAAHNNLAIVYEQLGLPEKAREEYEKALALEPKNALIQQNYELWRELHDRARFEDRR